MQYKGNELEWDGVRKLVQYGSNTFAYDAGGIWYQKNNITYTLDNSNIVKETDGVRTLIYYYGTNGVVGFRYNGNDYYYRKNLQGDVIEIYRADGTLVAGYEYDAWGKILRVNEYNNTGIGAINPFRYRSYYYDTETGLYYVKSRYYDPETGRFINADGYVSTGQDITGCNMFAYCGNNPVKRKDLTGQFWITALIAVVVVAACTVALSGCSNIARAPDLDIETAPPTSYNCYGNAIKKQINTNPTGCKRGDSVEEVFDAVKKDLGSDYVRELSSIDAPIEDDEYRVAVRCGPTDYHFIRETENGWYSKSGQYIGMIVPSSYVTGDRWIAKGIHPYDKVYVEDQFLYYENKIIYFAVKIGWDVSE